MKNLRCLGAAALLGFAGLLAACYWPKPPSTPPIPRLSFHLELPGPVELNKPSPLNVTFRTYPDYPELKVKLSTSGPVMTIDKNGWTILRISEALTITIPARVLFRGQGVAMITADVAEPQGFEAWGEHTMWVEVGPHGIGSVRTDRPPTPTPAR